MHEHELKQFLLRGWMTHDAMWLKNAIEMVGIERANLLNRAAIRDMTPIEVQRVLAALGMAGVSSFAELQTFLTGAMGLLAGDYFRYRWWWEPPDLLRVRVDECFAFKGLTRMGAIAGYQCGLLDRVYRWFDALGLDYAVSPAVEHCTMHHEGRCVREIQFTFSEAESVR